MKMYAIHWKSSVTGTMATGTKRFKKEEAEHLAAELNESYPDIHHEAVIPAPAAVEPADAKRVIETLANWTNMNAILVKKALEKVLNPNILVNLISQRVRQLTSGFGGRCRPLVADVGNLSAADIALREIIEDKMSFELPEMISLTHRTGKNRRRPQNWAKAA